MTENNLLQVFEDSKVSLNYDGKNIQGKIMLSDGSSVEIEPFEISESELNDCWYGFTYKGKDFDMNISLNDTENEGTPVCIYPVINGTTLTTSDFAAIKKDSVFFEKQIVNKIVHNNQMENKTMGKILSWDEIYRAAEGKAGVDWEVKVYDNARAYIGGYAKEHFGIDIEASEIPEDAIDDFLEKHPELNRFNESGQMLAEIDSENEILNKPFIPSEYVLSKLQEKGIEVVTDKKEFERILQSEELLQKMEFDLSEYDRLSKQLDSEKAATNELVEKKQNLEEKKEEIRRKNYLDFKDFVKSTERFIPSSEFTGFDHLNKVKNPVLLVEGKKYNLSSNYYIAFKTISDSETEPVLLYENAGLDIIPLEDYEKLKNRSSINFDDNSLLSSYKENLKIFLEKRITIERQTQNKLLTEVGNMKSDLLKASLDKESIEDNFVKLDNSLRFNANFEIESSELGESVSVFPGSTGKSGLGIRHIIEERFKKDNLSQDEITALTALVLESVKNGKITRDSDYQAEFTENGIVAIVRKDYFGKEQNWILTGFAYDKSDLNKNREATEAIKTVIANYSNSDGYSYFRSQVGAVITSLDSNISHLEEKSSHQNMILPDGTTYGFTHNNKIYLNPDVMNSEAAVHEYTHLWDNLTRKDNPMLWNKGLEIFRGTSIWNEVINDEHYQNIKDDENLVLSECHARITGKVAETVLNRIAELDGNEKQADMINWDKETINFIFENYRDVFEKNSFNSVADFTSATMKDLFGPVEQQKRDRKTEFTQASDMDLKLKVSELGFFMKLDAGWLLQDELAGSYAKEIVKDLNNNYFVIDNEAEEGSPDENPKPLDKVLLKSLVSEVIESIKMRNDEKLNVYSSNFDVGFTNAYESLVNLQREFEVESSQNKPFIPSEYVLNKLQEKGIEVITDKAKFNELLKASEILQIMEGDKKENLSDKYFQANQSEAEAFSKELDAFIADYDKTQKTINPLKMLNVGSITPVMKLLGIADVPVGIDQSTISKALREEPIYPDDEQGHKLTIDELKNIPQSLADPVMVFRSDSPTRRNKDSYVFFTEQRDFKNRSIIIPVAVNKKYGRLVINKVTSIYGRNQEIRYVKDNIQRGNLVYFDKKRSLEWERECKVQFLAQVLPIEGSINNILSKDSLVKFLDSKSEKMVKDGTTYGFTHNNKIYLNPDIMNSEAAVHEYTHLWDNLTRKENPMLWNKGLEIFKGTSIWNEVINDEHYQNIKDDENLVLSECHARITGKVAETVLNRIAELDGNEKQADMINWDKETINFIFENYRDVFEKNSFNSVAEFTTATMKDLFSPVEQQKQDIAIDSSAFERMEKFFEGKTSSLGNGDYQNFKELYDWVQEEFPSKDSEHVLLETVSRMIYSNINFGDLEPASYDDVYGFGDGAEHRFDVSDDIAKRLINNEISADWMTIQNEVNDFACRKLMDLKENTPDMLVTDTINEAFEISKKYEPIAEKNLNAYTKSEKTQNIQKALENIEKTYTEDSHDIRIDYGTGIFGADLEALIKGNDAAIYGEKSLDFVRPDRVSLELGIEDKIPFKDLIRGYGDNFASALLFDSEGVKVPRHIERWDYMEVFNSDYDAAQQWKLETGGKLLENGKNIWISDENLEYFYYPDTPENRVALKEYLLPQSLEFNWDNFTEEEFNEVKEEITSGNIKEDYKGQVYVGSVCVQFTITDKESNWVDYNNFILGEKGEGEISGIPYSYQNGKQVVMNTFTENSYENFKTVIENVLIEDMGKDSHLKQEAMRKTINWTTINENNKEAALKLWKEKEGITEEELEHIREQITYNIALTNLDFNNEEHVQKVKEMFGKDFDVSNDEAKVLLSYATCFGDGTHEYGLSKDGHLHFRTNQDNEGWSFITEDSMLTDFLTSAFDGAAILLDSDKTNDATLLNSFLNKNQTLLNDLDNNKLYELSLIDIKSKLQEIDENTKNFIVTHSVTFPCGFTFPPDLNNEAEMDAYRESQIEKIKEKYGCNDNEIESEIFDIDDPKNASFNIHFAVPVPEEINDNLEKVNEWIEGVENFVKEECGCTFINWQGGERNETVYENAKEYKMEKERKSDFANPNAEIMNVLSDALADSFNTLDYNPDYWQNLLDRGADPTRAIRIAAADANLADNLNWLLDNVPDERLKEIFSDKSYADEVFDIAKESVIHDEDSWQHIGDVGFAGFKRIAVLCERETEADRYYGECLEKLYKVPVEPKISQLLDTPELLAGKMNSNRIHQNEPEITESLAKAILDYCTFENIKFYCDNNEDIFSLDVSEDYTGEGMKESNFGIAANGIEYANKAKDYAYSIYNEETYNVVKDLWEKEKIFANPAQTQNEKQISFINDEEKMKDFPNISKEEFLSSYSYLSEEEYDATAKDYNELNQAAVPSRFSDTVKTVEDINKIYDRNLDFIEQNISFKYSNPEFNEIDEIEKWKNGELFIPLEDRNGNYTTDTEANTLEEYNSYANKNFKTYFEVIKYQAELKAKFLDSAIENSITEYLRREYAETSPNSARFEVTVENQSYPIDKEGLDFITDTNEWGSADDRLNEVIDRRFEEEIEQKEIDIVSDVLEYISQETNGNLVLKNTELSDVLFSDELIQIYSPKQEFLAIQPEETKAALIEAGIARGELYNNVEKEYDATANELKEHGRTGLQTVKALAYKNVMDKNYLAYDNRLEKSGSEADKIQSAIERLTDVSLPAVAGEIGKSEQEVAEIISALLDAKDYVEERFNVVRPTADEIIEKVRDEVSWADILKTELSWKELGLNPEDYDRTESGTETEKDFKEWAMGLELENALDLHGFDTALEGVSSWNNSTISEQKWMIIDKLSEEIVSGKLKIENSQDAFDKLLKENEVYKGFVQKGIVKDDVFGLREITEKDLKSVSAKEPVSEKARDEMLSANFAGHGGLTQKAFADNGIEIDIETANALENCFSQIEAITKYTADGHDLFKEGNGVDTIRERSIEYSEKEKAWIIHEKNWLALSAIKGNEAAPDDYMEKADRAVDRNWSINCEELVKFVYNEIKEDGEIEKEFPDTFKKLENLKDSFSKKEPLEIVKEVADKKELSEVPVLFKKSFIREMNQKSGSKDPFIITKSIINEWKVSKPDYIPVLNDYLKKQNCSSKEGFEKFFKQLTSHNQNTIRHKEKQLGYER